MKRQQYPSFSTKELNKMISRIDDAIQKIKRISDKLAKNQNVKETIALSQAILNLTKVRDRLAMCAEESLKRDVEKTLRRVKEILEKTHPQNSNSWNNKGRFSR